MQAFIAATGVDVFPNINDDDRSIWARYGVGYQPAFVFISSAGEQSSFGAMNEQSINEKIAQLF